MESILLPFRNIDPQSVQQNRRVKVKRLITCMAVMVLASGGAVLAGDGKIRKNADKVPNQYIVVLNDNASDVDADAQDLAGKHAGVKDKVYRSALKGFSVKMKEADAAKLALDPRVKYIEEDGYVRNWATQTGATWGLDRVDQRDLPLSTTYTYDRTGAGVKAYILDTGILATHVDLAGRVISGYDAVGGGTTDCNGHGTHVSGTVGGTTWGVAKNVTLVAVRVLDCAGSGTWAGVVAGIDWVTADHAAGQPAVANMSLGGAVNTSVNDAGDGRGFFHGHRCPLVVLEHRHLRRHLRARLEHHLGVVHVDDRHQHHQRHVHGDAPRLRRRGSLPRGESDRDAGAGGGSSHQQRHPEQDHRRRRGLTESSPLHPIRRGSASASASSDGRLLALHQPIVAVAQADGRHDQLRSDHHPHGRIRRGRFVRAQRTADRCDHLVQPQPGHGDLVHADRDHPQRNSARDVYADRHRHERQPLADHNRLARRHEVNRFSRERRLRAPLLRVLHFGQLMLMMTM
jgi:hypothetical protein